MPGSTKMVTSSEALHFVERVLGMSSPSTNIKTNPLNFLDNLTRAWLHHIPFQSVKGMATPHHLRHLPTVAEMKQDIMVDKIGGLCYQHNVFCSIVLQALGFNTTLMACDIGLPSDHAAVIVHNLTSQGSKHLVDVGNGNPMFHAVPFDFPNESPVYHDSFLRYKFSRQGNVIHCLHQVEGHPAKDSFPADKIIDGWLPFIVMHVEKEIEMSHFAPSMTEIYTVVGTSPFLTSVRSMAFPNGRFVCINNTTLLLENEAGCVTKSYFRSRDELKDAYTRYFPQFSEAMINDALNDENVKLDYEKGINK